MDGLEEAYSKGGRGHIEVAPGVARPGNAAGARQYCIQNFCSSLKQWRMLHALIDCGSYAEAAQALHVSQSTLSYTILKLQERLGVQLLRQEGRRAVLTATGKLLVERSRQVLDEARALEDFARKLE